MSRVSQFFALQYRRTIQGITQIRDTPHAIAGGVAIGLVFGFTPLWGFKTVIAVLVAWFFRCSKLSAALAVTFHDILLPVWPVILRWQFQIGFFIVNRPHRLPPKIHLKHLHYEVFLNWRNFFNLKTLEVLWPTFVGSLVIAIPVAIIMYFLVLEIVKGAQAVKARHGTHPGNASQ